MKSKAIKAAELDSLLNQEAVILLDIREEYEYEDDHLDSLHIPMAEVRSRIDELKPYQEIIICCKSGQRAQAMAHTLNCQLENKVISFLEGGLTAYRSLQHD